MKTILLNILLLCVVCVHAQSDTLPPEGYGAKIREADVACDSGDFRKALEFRPGDQFALNRIRDCEMALNSK